MSEQKPSMGRVVIYNHPGSADKKYPPMKSPAIIQNVYMTAVDPDDPAPGNHEVCDLFVMSGNNGIAFNKGCAEGEGPCQWNWPPRI